MPWTIKRDFESLDEFLDYVATTPPAWPGDLSSESSARAWNGNVTFAQALNLGRYGWPEGRDHMSTVTLDMKPQNIEVSAAITRQIDVAGAYPIVPLAVAGDPANMVDIIEADAPSRIIRCVVSIGKPGMIDAATCMANGGAVCSYIDALELAGWSCEIWATAQAKAGQGNKIEASVCVKQAGEMLDLDRLAFTLAHPAMLRRFMFRLREIEAKAYADFSGGYGQTYSKRPTDCQVFVPQIRGDMDGPEAMARVADSFELNPS